MIYHDLKSLDKLNKVKTVRCDTFVMQNSSSLILSSDKLFFSETNLAAVKWSSSWLKNISSKDNS